MDCIQSVGKQKYQKYVNNVLLTSNKPISGSISRVNHEIFKQQVKDLKQNVHLLGRLYINCIARGGDIDDFIRHENLPFPPSLSEGGELRSSGKKSQIVSCV